jgi:ketosteroid isomerase-like protein
MKSMDFAAMEGLWDREYGHLVYQPEEHGRACRSWEQIVAYWSYIPGVVASITEWREIESDVAVVGDAAIVYALFATSFQLKDVEEPLAGEVRFTFGLRRTPAGWRFIHCHESRQLVVDDAAG